MLPCKKFDVMISVEALCCWVIWHKCMSYLVKLWPQVLSAQLDAATAWHAGPSSTVKSASQNMYIPLYQPVSTEVR